MAQTFAQLVKGISATNAPANSLTIDSSGRVGIGTTSPQSLFHIDGDTTAFRITRGSATGFVYHTGTSTTSPFRVQSNDGSLDLYTRVAQPITFTTNDAERGRWDSSGRFLVGTSSARTFIGSAVNSQLQIEGTNDDTSIASITRNSNNTGSGRLIFGKSRGTANGAVTVVQSGDNLGSILFEGTDGTDTATAAAIDCVVDATPGNNDMPGRLVFSTTADGASSPTERMRITQSGQLLIGTASALIADSSRNRLSVDCGSGTFVAASFKNDAGASANVVDVWNAATTGNNNLLSFFTETSSTVRGNIDYNRSAGQVRYNVTSDRRLKSDIEDANSALSILDQIKVRSYTWTETGYGVEYGFIAQELNEAIPDAVKVGDDGDEVVDTWAVDNAKLVPLLTKALQEAIAEIASLKDRVAALEAA